MRRVAKDKITYDANQKRWRPSSDAFTDNLKDGSPMSVFDSSVCSGIDQVLKDHEDYYVVTIEPEDAAKENLMLVEKPDGGLGHCELVGKSQVELRAGWQKHLNGSLDLHPTCLRLPT
jgi:hypothetical protein